MVQVLNKGLVLFIFASIIFLSGGYILNELYLSNRKQNFNGYSQTSPTPTPYCIDDICYETKPEWVEATPTVEPTGKVQGSNSTNTNSVSYSDQIITCSISDNCGGGSRQMKRSECEQTTCCQLGDKWYFYLSRNKCLEDQKTNKPTLRPLPTNYPPCSIYYPVLGYSTTYTHLSPEDCKYYRNQASEGTTLLPTNTPAPTIDQKAVDEYNELLRQHSEACDQAVADWKSQKQAFMSNEYNNYTSSYEAMLELERRRQIYQQELYEVGCDRKIYLY